MEQEMQKLIKVIKEIIPALYREMGEKWCSNILTELNSISYSIELHQQMKNE